MVWKATIDTNAMKMFFWSGNCWTKALQCLSIAGTIAMVGRLLVGSEMTFIYSYSLEFMHFLVQTQYSITQ